MDLKTQNKLLITKLESMRVEIAKLKTQVGNLNNENILLNQRIEQLEQGYVPKLIFDKAIASIMNSIESLKSMHEENYSSEEIVDSVDLFLGNLFQQIADEREFEIFETREKPKLKMKSKMIEINPMDKRPMLSNDTVVKSLND